LPRDQAEERCSRGLQKPAPQAAPGLKTFCRAFVELDTFMPRLLGVEIPGEKRIEASLPYIYGLGPKTSKKILEQANIDPNIRAKNLTPEQLGQIVHVINGSGLLIEGDLRRDIQSNLKRLQAIRCYRGIRHIRGLPVRGQRTSTNARTRKGPRKTVGVQRNKDAKAGKV
jgi:small subunit ribosomal protein S13